MSPSSPDSEPMSGLSRPERAYPLTVSGAPGLSRWPRRLWLSSMFKLLGSAGLALALVLMYSTEVRWHPGTTTGLPIGLPTLGLALAGAFLAFFVSASAGLGGSLILVPIFALLLGVKQGVAAAALLLAINNGGKVVAFRRTIPWRASMVVVALTAAGSAVGARLLVSAPEEWVSAAVLAAFALTFLTERIPTAGFHLIAAPVLALGAGVTSGFAGTSGPLKGAALRHLRLDRLHFVGAASMVSLVGDLTKSAVFAHAALLDRSAGVLALCALPLVPVAVWSGRHLTRRISERAHAALFWAVMAGYSVRLLF